MKYIFIECPPTLTERGYEHVQQAFKSLREEDPDFPKAVILVDGIRIAAVSSGFELCRVQIDPDDEAVIDRILEAAAARARVAG